jgi:serine/threonine-protein kinase
MGESFGRYELIRRIGVGGMAEVFKARTYGPEGFVKDVVIKRILPAFSEDPDFVAMFINEARLAAHLNHANIVHIHDFGQTQGLHFIAMEWVEGTDLKRVINTSKARSMPIPLEMVLHVGNEALKGLHYAWNCAEDDGKPFHIIHRDISPHNLLVSNSGEIKITDFGIAKAEAIASTTRSGMVKGKVAYMSPEQAGNRTLDPRSDIFSLGIVLWELTTGVRLYQGESEAELFARVQRAEVESPRIHRPEISEEIEDLILRMLQASPDDRFRDAEEALGRLGPSAKGDGALRVAAYLRGLMPADLGSERRGETEVRGASSVPEVVPAAPGALTHTRGAERGESPAAARGSASASTGRSTTGQATAVELPGAKRSAVAREASPPTATDAPPLSSQRTVKRPHRPISATVILVGATLFATLGVAGWWGAGLLLPEETDMSGAIEAPQIASAEIKSDPPGAMLWINGKREGRAPMLVEAVEGTTIDLRAQVGELRTDKRRVLRGNASILLKLSAPSKPAANALFGVEKAGSKGPQVATGARALSGSADRSGRSSRSKAPRPRRWGFLDVVVSPWARVKIDGREVGQTPIRRYRISVGEHRVELFNQELGRREVTSVEVKVGERYTLRQSWD